MAIYALLLLAAAGSAVWAYPRMRPGPVALHRAERLLAGGGSEAVLPLLRKAGQDRGLSAGERLRVAAALRDAGDYVGAESLYRELLGTNVAGEARFRLAETVAWTGRFGEAADFCREMLALDPTDRRARLLLARVLSWDGRLEESIGQYRVLLGESS
ncbi:tetratricopeptide repeat protein [Desulfovibrio aminophilus]|uniref:tetratricopeptide repeat protein n=1 Tax=Desulfovibrio aminophilus TaxID=81425 RepID=UPI0033972FCE